MDGAGGASAGLEAVTGGKEIPPGPFAPNRDSLREHFQYPPCGIGPDYTASDIRFTTKGDLLYAVALGRPEGGKLNIKALASKPAHYPGEMGSVQWLGSPGQLVIVRDENGLTVSIPGNGNPNYATALKIIPQARSTLGRTAFRPIFGVRANL